VNEVIRWTYIHGTRAEGVRTYDDDSKCHSEHDTDPARGQHSAFDLCRIHRFGHLDKDAPAGTPINELPSQKAMVAFARELPEVRNAEAQIEFDELPPLSAEEEAEGAKLRPERKNQTITESNGTPEQSDVKETPRKARFRVIPANEFATDVPLEWLIKSVLPKAELAVIYGESGSGKSFQALDLAAAVSRGAAWRDHVVRRGRVVYVAAEGAGGFRQRLRAYARHHEVPLAELPGIVANAPNLLDLEDSKELTIQILAAGGADLVIVDTLARAMAGNENSGEDMSRVIAHCKAIHKATGALVVFVHHSGKDTTKGARGWSGLRAAADAELEVTRNGDFRLLAVRKMKDGTDDMQWGFKLDIVGLGMDSDGDELSSCVVVPAEVTGRTNARKDPKGAHEKTLLSAAREILQAGSKSVGALLEAAVVKMPRDIEDGKRDRRRELAKRALDALVANQFLFLPTPDTVSLTSAVESHDDF
jgi:RecA/RadA recombinase